MAKTISDLLQNSYKTVDISPKIQVTPPNVIKSTQKAAFDDEDLKDRASNRNQREEFTKKIILMMASEIIFIALLLFGIFLVPYINALAPQIILHLPPVFLSVSIVIGMIALYKWSEYVPVITISNYEIPLCKILKLLFIMGFLLLINILPRKSYVINFDKIVLSDNVINVILYAAVSVFIKTTILAGLIITGLYDVLKKK